YVFYAFDNTATVLTTRNRIVVSTKPAFKSFEGGNDLSETLTRAKLERLNNDPSAEASSPSSGAKDVGMEEGIDDVVIVGGSNRIPNVKSLFKDFFDSILAEIWATQSPDHRYDRPFPFVRFPIERDPRPPPSAILGITL
ncbi:ATPase with role in protein import into the ER, partial [Tulasnella sp. 408]